MRVAWIRWGSAASAGLLALLVTAPVKAAEPAPGVTAVAAEELDKRSKEAQAHQSQGQAGMSDSSVRVLMTYAFSVIPEEATTSDGTKVKVDKSDPNKYFIPTEDARRIIRAATRSAYAEVCGIPELGRENYKTLMEGEEAKKTWSPEQLVMIDALHVFSVSYFTGNIKITTKEVDETAQGDGTTGVPKAAAAAEGTTGTGDSAEVFTPEAPDCPPDQKQKVTNAINAYVQAAKAGSE